MIFSETSFRVYVVFDETQRLEHDIEIELIKNKEHCLATICINQIPDIDHQRDQTISRLTARTLIQELINSDYQNNIEEQRFMLDIALKFGLLCSLITFVEIERHLNHVNPQRQVPIPICNEHLRNNKVN